MSLLRVVHSFAFIHTKCVVSAREPVVGHVQLRTRSEQFPRLFVDHANYLDRTEDR